MSVELQILFSLSACHCRVSLSATALVQDNYNFFWKFPTIPTGLSISRYIPLSYILYTTKSKIFLKDEYVHVIFLLDVFKCLPLVETKTPLGRWVYSVMQKAEFWNLADMNLNPNFAI